MVCTKLKEIKALSRREKKGASEESAGEDESEEKDEGEEEEREEVEEEEGEEGEEGKESSEDENESKKRGRGEKVAERKERPEKKKKGGKSRKEKEKKKGQRGGQEKMGAQNSKEGLCVGCKQLPNTTDRCASKGCTNFLHEFCGFGAEGKKTCPRCPYVIFFFPCLRLPEGLGSPQMQSLPPRSRRKGTLPLLCHLRCP